MHSTYLSPFVQHTIALATLLTATPRSRPPASHSYTQTRPHRPATTCSLHLNLAYCTHRHDHRPYVQRTHLDLLSASLHSSLVPTARAPLHSPTVSRPHMKHASLMVPHHLDLISASSYSSQSGPGCMCPPFAPALHHSIKATHGTRKPPVSLP